MLTAKLGTSNRQQITVLASTISTLMAAQSMKAQAQEPTEEILVTGSRIVRRDLDASSPIVTVDAQRLENSSTISIESVLNQMPQFVPEGTQFDSGQQSSGAVTLGIASVNLRGIGPNRTLVLVDGRRPQPANASLVVDLNTIPSAAIERVETITGGASAVYGADALAGVVNFVLKKDFEGVDMDIQTGMTQEGDGNETRFTTLLGVNGESGNSNVMMGVEWYKREAVFQEDRQFYRDAWADPKNESGGFLSATGYSPGLAAAGIVTPAAALNRPTQAAVDTLFGMYGYAPGTVRNNNEIYFHTDGTPFTLSGINYHGPIMSYEENGDGFLGVRKQPNGTLAQVATTGFAATPAERRSVFGRAHVDLNDNLTAFAQATYSNIKVVTRGGYPPAITVWQAPIPNDGLHPLPPGLQELLNSRTRDPDGTGPGQPGDVGGASAQNDPWVMFRGIDFMQTPVEPTTETNAYQLMAGVQGSFTNRDWTWEAYVSTGNTDITATYNSTVSLQRYQFLTAQPNWGTSAPGTTFTRGRNYTMSCQTGLPIFSTVDPSPDCIEAIEAKMRPTWDLTQNIVEANLQGKILDMKAGELRFAVGAGTRENKFSYEPSEINDNVSIIEQPMNLFVSNNTAGSTDVSEIYGELLVPVTSGLNLELGYRYSDYSTAGGVGTYKTMFDWSATDGFRLRGGYQLATRAPNTEELFAGARLNTVNNFIYGDPCQVSTTAPWGNRPPNQWPTSSNPNYLQVQALCRQLIDRSDANPANDGLSAFNSNVGQPPTYQGTGPNGFVRPGLPFFQAENEVPHGNPNLGVEEAKTWTLGAVFTGPGSLENLTASVDFYQIDIADAIATLNSTFVYAKCFNADGVSNPTYALHDAGGYCDLITREVNTGERSLSDAPYKNSGALSTAGVDIAINWTHDVGSGGSSLYVNSLLTYLDSFEIQDAAGEPVLDVRDTLSTTYYGAQYKYKVNSTFGYNFGGGKASLGLNWRYLPSIRSETATRNPATTQLGADSYQIFSLFTRFAINDKLEFRGGIDNLLDEDPVIVEARPGIDSNSDVTRPDYYDILGRRAYIGLKMSF
jgi:iron complex outermembrane receptor protein